MKLLCVLLMILLLASVVSAGPAIRRYDAIFSFGNSHADTGNGIPIYAERSFFNPSAGPPYGMEFFGHPTGRNSNGRLIIDFIGTLMLASIAPFLHPTSPFFFYNEHQEWLVVMQCALSACMFAAEDLGLPFVPPSLVHNGSFCHGANFAVAGAFARNASFYSDLPIVGPFALNASSSVQLQWFDSLKPSLSLCSSREQGTEPLTGIFASLRSIIYYILISIENIVCTLTREKIIITPL
jgi:hypothetical protein